MRIPLTDVRIAFPAAWSSARLNYLPVQLTSREHAGEVLVAPDLEQTLRRACAGSVERGWDVHATLDLRLAMIVDVTVRARRVLHPTTLVASARGHIGAERFDAVLRGQGETWAGLCRQLAFRHDRCDDLSEDAFMACTERGLRVYVTDGNADLPRDEANFGVEVVDPVGDILINVVVRQDHLILNEAAA